MLADKQLARHYQIVKVAYERFRRLLGEMRANQKAAEARGEPEIAAAFGQIVEEFREIRI